MVCWQTMVEVLKRKTERSKRNGNIQNLLMEKEKVFHAMDMSYYSMLGGTYY